MLQLADRKYSQSRQLLARTRKETAEQFAVTTCAEHPELFEASVVLENETWDELSFLDYTAAHHDHYDELLERFPEYHLCMIELQTGELVATGMCVPLHVPDQAELPREGWDWVVIRPLFWRRRYKRLSVADVLHGIAAGVLTDNADT